jgi:integrase
MAVLQEVMAHFYFKAKALKSLGADAPFEEIDDLASRLAVQRGGMTAKNRERLRPFDDA